MRAFETKTKARPVQQSLSPNPTAKIQSSPSLLEIKELQVKASRGKDGKNGTLEEK